MSKKKGMAASGPKSMLLGDVIPLFLAQHKLSTRKTYLCNLQSFTSVIDASRAIETITPLDLLVYQQSIEGSESAAATRANLLKMVKIFFNWLVKVGLLRESPARLVKIPRTSSAVTRDKAMSEEEFERVLAWVKWDARDYAAILFIADSACRAGGAAGLKWEDINFADMRAVVTEKGEKSRPVSFAPVCARALKVWREKKERAARAKGQEMGEYVFSRNSGPISATAISRIVRRACERVGIRSLGSHSLRHRKGHQMAYGLTPPTLAARAMGHSTKVYLESYAPTSWDEVDQVMRKFGVKEEDVEGTARLEEKKDKPRIFVLKRG